MTDEKFGSVPAVEHGDRWPTAVASLAVGSAFFGLWFWLLPQWLGFRVEMAGAAHWRWLGAPPSVLGLAVALRCLWDFGWTGRGTPAPVAPPQVGVGQRQISLHARGTWIVYKDLQQLIGRFHTCGWTEQQSIDKAK